MATFDVKVTVKFKSYFYPYFELGVHLSKLGNKNSKK